MQAWACNAPDNAIGRIKHYVKNGKRKCFKMQQLLEMPPGGREALLHAIDMYDIPETKAAQACGRVCPCVCVHARVCPCPCVLLNKLAVNSYHTFSNALLFKCKIIFANIENQ